MELPQIALLRQRIPAPELTDPLDELRRGLSALELGGRLRPGARVAVTAGSRGVTDMLPVLREVVAHLKSLGAEPFVAPAMGSHGGATDQGQAEVLKKLGITEQSVGAPIVSNVETVQIADSSYGEPVLVGRDFAEADHVVLVNRVKPHTSFRGVVESGLFKMMVIGMGKPAGARVAHRLFLRHGFEPVVLEFSRHIMEKLPILCGVALVENRLERTAALEVLEPGRFLEVEKELLVKARELMGRVPFEDVALLVVDEIGKNISGAGLDSNVTGRIMHQATPEPRPQRFRRIYLRDLTDESGGNALGMGTADFISRRLREKIDLEKTRINCVTATVPEKGRIPITYDHDRQAILDALSSAGVSRPQEARMVWIKNTLELDYMWISGALADEARSNPQLELLTEFRELPFDQDGDLPFDSFRLPQD